MKETKEIELQYNWKYKGKYDTLDWMINDLWRGIQTESNYLVTLGIFIYSEAIGWNISMEDNKKKTWICFLAFNKYLKTKITKDEYKNIRDGLVHNYFVKGEKEIRCKITIDESIDDASIIVGEVIKINAFKLFIEFVRGVEGFLDEKFKNGGIGPLFDIVRPNFYSGRGETGPAQQ